MNKFALAAVLLFGSPISAPVLRVGTVLTGETAVIDGLRASGVSVNPYDYSDHSLISLGINQSTMFLYWIDKTSLRNLPNSVFMSVSNSINEDSLTGYDELYRNYSITLYNRGFNDNAAFYCFKVSGLDCSKFDRFLIQSLRYGFGEGSATEVDYPTVTDNYGKKYGIEYQYHRDSETFTTKTYRSEQVTDKFVSYFMAGSQNVDPTGVGTTRPILYQEHYIAFNFPVDIDKINEITIQSTWELYYGETNVSADHYLYTFEDDYPNLNIESLYWDDHKPTAICDISNCSSSNPEGWYIYDVYPKSKNYQITHTLFGHTTSVTEMPWNTITDLYNTPTFKEDTVAALGDNIYPQLVSSSSNNKVFNADGSSNYRWFVNFEENKVNFEPVAVRPGSPAQHYQINSDAPLKKSVGATIVYINYEKDGKTYESLVVDQATDSTLKAYPVFAEQVVSNLPEWLAWMITIVVLLAVVIALILVPKLWKGVTLLAKAVWFVLKLVIDVVYLVLVWWWLIIIKKVTGEDLPPLWLWSTN